MGKKYNELVSSLYVMNIVFQCIFSLASPAALGFLISWLLTSKLGAPDWIYAPLIAIGTICGFISMIKIAISASEALERLEKERDQKTDKNGDPGDTGQTRLSSDKQEK